VSWLVLLLLVTCRRAGDNSSRRGKTTCGSRQGAQRGTTGKARAALGRGAHFSQQGRRKKPSDQPAPFWTLHT